MLSSNRFKFLNQVNTLPNRGGWNNSGIEKLWLYNLHYFDDLNAIGASERLDWHKSLINRWISENRPTYGVGWEPYPTSLRLVNWVKWLLDGNTPPNSFLQSLVIQARWLAKRIERHILGNHLFANAKALIFAGLFFDDAESTRWFDCGLKIISEELHEQVLRDGGNFERSPMYHIIFLEDLLDLINLANAYPAKIPKKYIDEWRGKAGRMLYWLKIMCHPDGEISFFNDSAAGIAPSPEIINEYASRLNIILTDDQDLAEKKLAIAELSDSGYIRLNQPNAVAFLDVARIGPDYLPGHAHADTLAFELSLFGKRVVVNGGCSQYGTGPDRQNERSTRAHSTVEIDGENSSEVWSGFRVARRAYPQGLSVEKSEESISVVCEHDGFSRLRGKPTHRRTWEFSYGRLVIRDQIFGDFSYAISRFHLHPEAHITRIDDNKLAIQLQGCAHSIQFFVLSGELKIEDSFYSPEFGIRIHSWCVTVYMKAGADSLMEISWCDNE